MCIRNYKEMLDGVQNEDERLSSYRMWRTLEWLADRWTEDSTFAV
jgi:hypothetical protein